MIRNVILTSLVVLSSCSSARPQWQDLATRPDYRQRLIPVSNLDEAKKVMGNKVNFLKMLFEQTIDPYFGTPKWSPACLEINKVGEVLEITKGIQSTSDIILNPGGDPGYCLDKTVYKPSYVVYFYCEGMTGVTEIKFSKVEGEEKLPGNLCD